MKRFLWIIILYLSLSLTNCSSVVVTDEHSPSRVTSTSNKSFPDTAQKPTATINIFTNNPTTIPNETTITPSSHDVTVNTCWEFSEVSDQSLHLDGYIVLEQSPVNSNDSAFLFDLEDRKQIPVTRSEGEYYQRFTVSPDGKWLAYEIGEASFPGNTYLVVSDRNGEEQIRILLDESESRFGWWGYWINPEWLLIRSFPVDSEEYTSERAVNPFTEEERFFNPLTDYTGYSLRWYTNPPIWNGMAILSPDMRWAIYPSENEEAYFLRMWDLENGESIDEFSKVGFTSAVEPKWNSDGKKFVISLLPHSSIGKSHELFIGDLSGSLRQMTYLDDNGLGGTINNYSWSPDGRKIAFWLGRQGEEFLALLDVENMVVENTCLLAGYYIKSASAPLWSSDSQYIIVGSKTDSDAEPSIIVISLIERIAIIIAAIEYHDPTGWLWKDIH